VGLAFGTRLLFGRKKGGGPIGLPHSGRRSYRQGYSEEVAEGEGKGRKSFSFMISEREKGGGEWEGSHFFFEHTKKWEGE